MLVIPSSDTCSDVVISNANTEPNTQMIRTGAGVTIRCLEIAALSDVVSVLDLGPGLMRKW